MSKARNRSNTLPTLQKRILLHLAKNEPRTAHAIMVEFNRKDYKAIYTSFNALKEKKLICKAKTKIANKKEYEECWLTHEGIITAILEGVNLEKLIVQTTNLYPEDKEAQLFLDLARYIDSEIIEMTNSGVREKGSITFLDIMNLIFLQAPIETDLENAKKLTETLKKYPEAYALLKGAKNTIIEQLNLIIPD
jgi:hypothetical protein